MTDRVTTACKTFFEADKTHWGSLGGTPGQNETLNFAWAVQDRDRLDYAQHELA